MEENNKGFTVKDKRLFSQEEKKEEDKEKDFKQPVDKTYESNKETSDESKKTSSQTPLPEVTFSSFILSLSSSALFHFGELPDPVSKQKQKNIILAKQTIDILGILEQKTKGNLSKEEESLMENLLYDLRMRYIQETKK